MLRTLPLAILAALLVGCSSEPSATKPESTEPTATTGSTSDNPGSTSAGSEAEKPVEEKPVVEEKLPEKPKDGEEVAVIETGKGQIVVMFYPSKAPKTVENFKKLIKSGFYNGTRFHRCIDGFMIQGGDPLSKDMKSSQMWGTGGQKNPDGSELNVPAEFNDVLHVRGVLSMARSQDPNSASSQFFIVQKDSPSLDGQYTAFGKALSGLDVVDKIVVTGDPQANGAVKPNEAIVLKTARLAKWPF